LKKEEITKFEYPISTDNFYKILESQNFDCGSPELFETFVSLQITKVTDDV